MQRMFCLAAPVAALVTANCAATDRAGIDDTVGSSDAFARTDIEHTAAARSELLDDIPQHFFDIKAFSRLVGIGKTSETLVVGLDGRLRVFRDEDFTQELASFEGKPRSLLHYRQDDRVSADWLDNYKKISVLGTKGPKLRIGVDGEEGWIPRHSVKFHHAPFIVTEDGRYVADVFTDRLTYKGSRVHGWFVAENNHPVLVMRLAEPAGSHRDDRYLKYKYNPALKKFTDVRISKKPVAMDRTTTVWELLDREQHRMNFLADTGYSRPLPAQSDDGILLLADYGGLPRNPETPAVKIGRYIYVNY